MDKYWVNATKTEIYRYTGKFDKIKAMFTKNINLIEVQLKECFGIEENYVAKNGKKNKIKFT